MRWFSRNQIGQGESSFKDLRVWSICECAFEEIDAPFQKVLMPLKDSLLGYGIRLSVRSDSMVKYLNRPVTLYIGYTTRGSISIIHNAKDLTAGSNYLTMPCNIHLGRFHASPHSATNHLDALKSPTSTTYT